MVTTVSVLGEIYRIKADLPEEKLRLISDMINQKAVRFIERYKGLPKDKVFLLVAFEIGEELVKLQDILEYNNKKVKEIFQRMERFQGDVELV